MRILVAEDEYACRYKLQRLLCSSAEVVLASDGKQAWESFRTAWEQDQRYDAAIIDLMMPEVTGLELLDLLRDYEESKGRKGWTRIVVITGVNDDKTISQAYTKLADSVLIKPVLKADLLEKLKIKTAAAQDGINTVIHTMDLNW